MADLRDMLRVDWLYRCSHLYPERQRRFSTDLSRAKLTRTIEHALTEYMGRPIATTLRTRAELSAIVMGSPFADVVTEPETGSGLLV